MLTVGTCLCVFIFSSYWSFVKTTVLSVTGSSSDCWWTRWRANAQIHVKNIHYNGVEDFLGLKYGFVSEGCVTCSCWLVCIFKLSVIKISTCLQICRNPGSIHSASLVPLSEKSLLNILAHLFQMKNRNIIEVFTAFTWDSSICQMFLQWLDGSSQDTDRPANLNNRKVLVSEVMVTLTERQCWTGERWII